MLIQASLLGSVFKLLKRGKHPKGQSLSRCDSLRFTSATEAALERGNRSTPALVLLTTSTCYLRMTTSLLGLWLCLHAAVLQSCRPQARGARPGTDTSSSHTAGVFPNRSCCRVFRSPARQCFICSFGKGARQWNETSQETETQKFK